MRHESFDSKGRLRERRDDVARTVTTWDDSGAARERAYTQDEVAAADAAAAAQRRETRAAQLLDSLDAARQANRDFLALQSVTTAQAISQVKSLTRQNTALLQLVLRLAGRADALDDEGTTQ